MGKASSSKRVARASKMAGRARRGRNLWYPAALLVVVAVGVTLVVVSRDADNSSDDPLADQRPYYGDHWHAAYGVYTCDQYIEAFPDSTLDVADESTTTTAEAGDESTTTTLAGDESTTTTEAGDESTTTTTSTDANANAGDGNGINAKGDGVNATGDGLIHMQPLNERYIGDGANLGAFADSVGMVLSDDALTLPDGTRYENGDDCGGTPGEVQVRTWTGLGDADGATETSDLADFAPANGSLVTIAFAPVDATIGQPPSAGVEPADTTTTTEATTTTTTPPVGPVPATTTTVGVG